MERGDRNVGRNPRIKISEFRRKQRKVTCKGMKLKEKKRGILKRRKYRNC